MSIEDCILEISDQNEYNFHFYSCVIQFFLVLKDNESVNTHQISIKSSISKKDIDIHVDMYSSNDQLRNKYQKPFCQEF